MELQRTVVVLYILAASLLGSDDKLQSTEVKAENDGNADGVIPGVSSEIVDAIEELINRTLNLESAQLMMQQKLDGVAQELRNDCYKGMASLTRPSRTLITVLENRTALCDTMTDGGGWVVFQRRTNGRENFYRGWSDYKAGFGDVTEGGDYWLGNDAIHQLTSMSKVELRVDMEKDGQQYYAQYSTFSIGNETTDYILNVDGYHGDAGDSLHDNHNNMKFGTFDRDGDITSSNCASDHHGAWWYSNCYYSNLNGLWGTQSSSGIHWDHDIGGGLYHTEMKIRLFIS